MSCNVRGNRDHLSCFWVANFFCGAFFFGEGSKPAEINPVAVFESVCNLGENQLDDFSGFDLGEEKLSGNFFDKLFLVHFDFWMYCWIALEMFPRSAGF